MSRSRTCAIIMIPTLGGTDGLGASPWTSTSIAWGPPCSKARRMANVSGNEAALHPGAAYRTCSPNKSQIRVVMRSNSGVAVGTTPSGTRDGLAVGCVFGGDTRVVGVRGELTD